MAMEGKDRLRGHKRAGDGYIACNIPGCHCAIGGPIREDIDREVSDKELLEMEVRIAERSYVESQLATQAARERLWDARMRLRSLPS
jgi:hypothetical protein